MDVDAVDHVDGARIDVGENARTVVVQTDPSPTATAPASIASLFARRCPQCCVPL
jgi:hypothetical protein